MREVLTNLNDNYFQTSKYNTLKFVSDACCLLNSKTLVSFLHLDKASANIVVTIDRAVYSFFNSFHSELR